MLRLAKFDTSELYIVESVISPLWPVFSTAAASFFLPKISSIRRVIVPRSVSRIQEYLKICRRVVQFKKYSFQGRGVILRPFSSSQVDHRGALGGASGRLDSTGPASHSGHTLNSTLPRSTAYGTGP